MVLFAFGHVIVYLANLFSETFVIDELGVWDAQFYFALLCLYV